MTPPSTADSARPGLLEEVLGEYLQRLDRGEAVDREQLLARHPELAEELRSYFADSDEVERIARQAGGRPTAVPCFPTWPEKAPSARVTRSHRRHHQQPLR